LQRLNHLSTEIGYVRSINQQPQKEGSTTARYQGDSIDAASNHRFHNGSRHLAIFTLFAAQHSRQILTTPSWNSPALTGILGLAKTQSAGDEVPSLQLIKPSQNQ